MASPLADAHIRGQQRLRQLAARVVGQAWDRLPSHDEANVPQFLKVALPVVAAAQRQSVSLTDAYLARSLERRTLGINPDDIIGPHVRAGASPSEVYRRPFVTVWTALGKGTPYRDAIAAGQARATSAAEMDVQLASRGAFAAAQQADHTIRGYQRVADAGACEFCRAVDGAFVKSALAMPLHNHCGCSLEPIVDVVHDTPLPAAVAVHNHGELGAVLTAPGDHFTTL